jgi:hypothetical protein
MGTIYAEIARARRSAGVTVVGRHFCTHLYGAAGAVFDALRAAFAAARAQATHVVMTVTLSAHSPSLAAGLTAEGRA